MMSLEDQLDSINAIAEELVKALKSVQEDFDKENEGFGYISEAVGKISAAIEDIETAWWAIA